MLADFGQSGIALAANASKSADYLPGYSVWARGQSDNTNPPMVYGQTNDGLLYVVDPQDGEPKKIILPPPSLLPMRIASLKTMPGAKDNRVWVEVVTEDGKGGGKRSIPGFILDGSLQVKHFDFGSPQSHDWRKYMLGTLGRGGKGLYMMDVSDHKNPKFKWYVEKYGSQMVSMNESTPVNAPNWLDLSKLSANDAAWRKLGYNGARPAMGVTLKDNDADNPQTRNIVVVPGGIQSKIDLANNGNEGAVLIVLDPKDGSIIKAFDSNTLDKDQTSNWKVGNAAAGRTPYMGMIVSEPTLMASTNASSKFARYITGRAYAADNRGNIFEVVMENNDGSSLQPSGWYIRTAATLQSKNQGSGGTDKNFAVPHGIALGKEGGNTAWLVGGTANVDVEKGGDMKNGDGAIGQMLFSFKAPMKPGAADRTIYRDDLYALKAHSNDSAPSGSKGWYMALDTVASAQQKIIADESTTARPVVLGNTMYVATYTMSGIDLTGVEDICNASARTVSGYSRLYALDIRDGASALKGKGGSKPRFIQASGVKITGVTTLRNNDGSYTLAYTYDLQGRSPANDPDFMALVRDNDASIQDGVIYMRVKGGATPQALPAGSSMIYYWTIK
jgi:Tfp pilus tip-associated adhesin PilY1